MLDADTMAAMKLSIEKTGQLYPGTIDQNRILLEGRMRKHCCDELGIPFKVQARTFATDLERERFIIASNSNRRQFGLDQNAALIVDTYFEQYEADGKAAMAEGGAKGGSAKGKGQEKSPDPSPKPSNSVRERFLAEWSVSDYRSKLAIKLFKDGHDLLEEVIAGKLTLNQAIKALQTRTKPPKKKKVVGKPDGNNKDQILEYLSQEETEEIEDQCAEWAAWIDERFPDDGSRNEADDVVEAYFRQRKTDRQDAGAGANGEEAGE